MGDNEVPDIRTAEGAIATNELEAIHGTLVQRRRELLSLYEHDIRVGQESSDENFDDFVDRANNSYYRELMFSLSDTEREMLIQVEEALERLKNGTYGSCIFCGDSILLERLKAVAWTRYCFHCQELQELGLLEGNGR